MVKQASLMGQNQLQGVPLGPVAAHAKPLFFEHLAEAYPAFRSRCYTGCGNGNEIPVQ
jgi:hypothetical protein